MLRKNFLLNVVWNRFIVKWWREHLGFHMEIWRIRYSSFWQNCTGRRCVDRDWWSQRRGGPEPERSAPLINTPLCAQHNTLCVFGICICPGYFRKRETSLNNYGLHQIGLRACLWVIVLVVNGFGRAQSFMGGTILRLVVLDCIKQLVSKPESEPEGDIPLRLLPWVLELIFLSDGLFHSHCFWLDFNHINGK